MKKIAIAITIILWMIITLILGISIIGYVVFTFEDENYNSSWFKIGLKLVDELIK